MTWASTSLARNRALAELVAEFPPPHVGDTLGYSHQVAFKHAEQAAEPWARYAGYSGAAEMIELSPDEGR